MIRDTVSEDQLPKWLRIDETTQAQETPPLSWLLAGALDDLQDEMIKNGDTLKFYDRRLLHGGKLQSWWRAKRTFLKLASLQDTSIKDSFLVANDEDRSVYEEMITPPIYVLAHEEPTRHSKLMMNLPAYSSDYFALITSYAPGKLWKAVIDSKGVGRIAVVRSSGNISQTSDLVADPKYKTLEPFF